MDILMKIIFTVLVGIPSGLIGAFIGAWINNVFTWKIKNKIEILDSINKDFALLNMRIRLHKKEPIDELMKQLEQTKINLLLGSQIIDPQKIPTIFTNGNKIIDNAIGALHKEACDLNILLNEFGEFSMYIKKEREKITSFCYMLKELNPFKNLCTK